MRENMFNMLSIVISLINETFDKKKKKCNFEFSFRSYFNKNLEA